MLRKQLTLLLGLALLLAQTLPAHGQSAAVAAAAAKSVAAKRQKESAKRIEKLRRVVNRVGVGRRITIFLENGDDLHGTVSRIGEEDFEVAEVDQRRIITVPYAHVKKVRSGYRPHPDIFTGERNAPPIGMRIAAFAGLIFAVALPLIILGSAKE
jgi:hypothetical protein